MTNQIKSTLQYFYRYSIRSVRQFWLIYFLVLVLMLLLSIPDSASFHLTGITSFPSLIFMIFFSLLSFKNIFPFVIKLGVTRKAYIISTYIYAVILSLLMTVLNYIYLYLFNFIADLFAIDGFDFTGLNMEGFIETTFGNVYLYDWLLHISLFLVFTFIGAFFYRFGLLYGSLLLAVFPLSLFIRDFGIKFIESLRYLSIFYEHYTPVVFFIIIIISIIVNWFVVHKASVIDQVTNQN